MRNDPALTNLSGFPAEFRFPIMGLKSSVAPMRIDETFAALKAANRKAFIAYVAAGDPSFDLSLEIMHTLAEIGADVIELGLPFSDPLADGIVNQMAADRALKAGMTTARTLELIRAFRKTDHKTPLVLFTYLNPIFTYGFGKFQKDAVEAGADGVLLLDLPPDEASLSTELAENHGLSHIRLIAPSTPPERVKFLAQQAEGFIYALSRSGVTGGHSAPAETIPAQVAAIKAHTDVPVCVGFGISNPEQAAMVAKSCDGVIVGSAIVKQVELNLANPAEAVRIFTKPLIDAIR
jgi:tryptophan synthase alpha chain